MQVQKENIRWAIENAALNEFFEKGYEKTSIRTIAARAGISVGNVYRYFKNKAEIFSILVEPVYKQINTMMFSHEQYEDVVVTESNFMDLVDTILPYVITFFIQHRKQLVLLFLKSAGTQFEPALQEIYKEGTEHFKEHLEESAERHERTPFFPIAKPVTISIIAGLTEILQSDISDEEMKKVIDTYCRYHFIAMKEMRWVF